MPVRWGCTTILDEFSDSIIVHPAVLSLSSECCCDLSTICGIVQQLSRKIYTFGKQIAMSCLVSCVRMDAEVSSFLPECVPGDIRTIGVAISVVIRHFADGAVGLVVADPGARCKLSVHVLHRREVYCVSSCHGTELSKLTILNELRHKVNKY